MGKYYISLTYKCNHSCISCPIDQFQKGVKPIQLNDLIKNIEDAIDLGLINPKEDHIELSGGEPTLYPDFLPFLDFLTSVLGMNINILTNSTMFGKESFLNNFTKSSRGKTRIITAIYSHLPMVHDSITRRTNSFNSTLQGVNNLIANGIPVGLKTIIQKKNYQGLARLSEFLINNFDENVSFSYHSMDLRGLALDNKNDTAVELLQMAPYLEEALDIFLDYNRSVKVYSVPLCILDPYYWNFLSAASKSTTKAFSSPELNLHSNLFSDSGTNVEKCKNCALELICPGVWYSYLNKFGVDELVPFSKLEE